MNEPAPRADRRGPLLRLGTAFVIGFVSLTLEIAYTRVISFKLFYYYTYFVIGLALLGLGAAGAFTALSNRLRLQDPIRLVQRVAPIAGGVGVLGYLIVARLPTDVNLIWTGSIRQAVWQLLLLLVLSVSLTGVFFAVGLLFASLVVNQASEMRRLYFWDLTGAALGCLVAVPLQATVGPPTMILASMVLLALLGLAVTVLSGRPWTATTAITVVVAIAGIACGQLKVLTDHTKTLRDTDTVQAGDWGAVFRVDAVDLGDLQVLHHDGLWGSSIWRYDGTRATTARFDHDDRQIPFAALERRAVRVDHRRRRRQRDHGRAHLWRVARRRRGTEPGDGGPAAQSLCRLLRARGRGPAGELRAGRRAHLPRPVGDGLRPDLVRGARQLRRVERSDLGCVRAVRELPVHAADDRDRVRPPVGQRHHGRPVRRLRLRSSADAHGPLPDDGTRGPAAAGGDVRPARRPHRRQRRQRPREGQHDHVVPGGAVDLAGRCDPRRTGQRPERDRQVPPGGGACRRADLRPDHRHRCRGGGHRRGLPVRDRADRRRPAVLLALHQLRHGADRLAPWLRGQRDRHRRTPAGGPGGGRCGGGRAVPVAALRAHPASPGRRHQGAPAVGACSPTSPRSDSGSCSSRSR